MKRCKLCLQPLSGLRRVFCSDACYFADKTIKLRMKYQTNTEFAKRKNAYSRAWSKAHPERRRERARQYLRRRKAERFAAVLERVRP